MGYYAIPGSHSAVTSSYKTAAQGNATGANKRGKVFEIMVGTTANPNATDTYLQWDLSRITATGAGAYTAWTPTLLDPADGVAVNVSGITATAEATAFTASSSIWNVGVNQRGTLRWVAAQESQYLIWPAVAGNGLALRGLSSTYTGTTSAQLTFQE